MPLNDPLPHRLAQKSFTTAEGLRLGVSPQRLGADDLIIRSRGIRTPELARESLLERARPYTDLHRTTALSHLSAAAVHRIPLPGWAEDASEIDLSRAGPTEPGASERLGKPRRTGVRGHRLRLKDDEVMMLGGTRITNPERTWLDLCGIRRLTMDDVIVAGEHLVSEHERTFHPRTAVVPLPDLRRFVEGRHRVVGLGRARIALELLAIGVDSPQESRLRQMLERAGLPRFIPNCPVTDPWGETHWVDLGAVKFRVAIEYEGEHHLSEEQIRTDASRDRSTQAAGWIQVKITKEDMARGEEWVVAKVLAALRAHGYRG